MASRVLRILLVLGLAAAAGVAGWQVWQVEQLRAEQRTERARLDAISLRTTRARLDLRASQRAYLSPGQGIAFWKARVDQHLLTLRDDLQALKNSVPSSPAIAADDAALDALGDVTRLERRIAEHVEAGRLDHAADLVYADNIRSSLALDRAVDAALTAHHLELQAQQTDLRWREGGILALTAFAGFLLAFLITPSRAVTARESDAATGATEEGRLSLAGISHVATTAPQADTRAAADARHDARDRRGTSPVAQPRPSSAKAPAAAAASSTTARTAAAAAARADVASAADVARTARGDLAAVGAARGAATPSTTSRLDPERGDLATPAAIARAATEAQTGSASTRSTTAPSSRVPAAATAPTTPTTPTAVDDELPPFGAAAGAPTILAAAELSVLMARVSDASGLQPLLARVADQLDAVGMIVWLQDADGRTLKPALTHGYAADTLAHLHAIDRDADNATARAFRTGQPQKVASRDTTAAGPRAELGALVVPMETASGCVGVIAAELRHGREHDPATLALTRIVAAQLAMLTAPPD